MCNGDNSSRIAERLALWRETAEFVCTHLCRSAAADESDPDNSFFLNEDKLEAAVRDYWKNVDIFKAQNYMEGKRILPSKIAVLSALVLLHHKPIEFGYSISGYSGDLDIVHTHYGQEWLALVISLASMYIDIGAIGKEEKEHILYSMKECAKIDSTSAAGDNNEYAYSPQAFMLLMALMESIYSRFHST